MLGCLFENGKHASVSHEEILAMRNYLESSCHWLNKEVYSKRYGKNTLLEEKVTLLPVNGIKCLAQLQKLGDVVSYKLS